MTENKITQKATFRFLRGTSHSNNQGYMPHLCNPVASLNNLNLYEEKPRGFS